PAITPKSDQTARPDDKEQAQKLCHNLFLQVTGGGLGEMPDVPFGLASMDGGANGWLRARAG
ncbi:hypothetical protein, partial [Streptomyces alanosinicus]|uniref:hypothetical protein n=1 Tax=Streptomyces alanosinicus TaxID=68171 RepID=UPI001E29A633